MMYSITAMGDGSLHIDSGWQIKPVSDADLKRVSSWISTLMDDPGSREDVLGWLNFEWKEMTSSGYADFYVARLYDQPFLHITAIKRNQTPSGTGIAGLKLLVIMSPNFEDSKEIWIGALRCALNFFYETFQYDSILVALSKGQNQLKDALIKLGCELALPEGNLLSTRASFIDP